jgi:hypothetical protein
VELRFIAKLRQGAAPPSKMRSLLTHSSHATTGAKAMKNILRATGLVFLWVLLISALAAIGLLVAAPHAPGLAEGSINIFDWSVPVDQALNSGFGTALIAWLAIWFALLVAFFAVLFAFGVTVLALGGVALALAAPFLVLALLIWWIASRANRDANTLPPTAA